MVQGTGQTPCRPADGRRRGIRERSRTHHRGRRRPAARPHRRPRAAPDAAALPRAEHRRVPQRRDRVRRRQPAVVRPGLRRGHPLGWSDRLAGAGRRRHADRRGRGHRGPRRAQGPHEGRPAARRPRLLCRERPRVVGTTRAWPSRHPAQRAGRCPRQAERVRRAGHPRVDGSGVPGRRRRPPVGPVPVDGPHRADQGPRAQEVRRHRDRAVHRRADRRDHRAVPGRAPPRRRPALVGGRRGGRRARADGEGPAHRHRHDLLARRYGHGPLRRRPAADRCPEPPAHPPLLPPRRPQRPRRDAARPLGPRVRPPVG